MDSSEKDAPIVVSVHAQVVTTSTVSVTGDVNQDGRETTVMNVSISLQRVMFPFFIVRYCKMYNS